MLVVTTFLIKLVMDKFFIKVEEAKLMLVEVNLEEEEAVVLMVKLERFVRFVEESIILQKMLEPSKICCWLFKQR